MDRLGNIEAFVKAAEAGSFTAAARRLHLSPSALSRRVAQLEATVGVRLLLRTTRAVRLSDEGRTFLEHCRGALRELEEAHQTVTGLGKRPAGLLRVEAPTMLGRLVLAPALPRFTSRYRDVRLDLRLADDPSDLVSDGVDVALRHGALADSGLIARKVGQSRMRVCGSPAYLRRAGVPRSVDALACHERLGLWVHGRIVPWRLRDGERERELPPGDRLVVNSGEALIDLAVAGGGLAWVCDFMVARALAAGQLVEVLRSSSCLDQPVHVVTLPARNTLPKVQAFSAFVAAELARLHVP